MKKVYLAGPLFNKAEKDFNLQVCKVLEDAGYNVFLPQRDGIESALVENMTGDEKAKKIFHEDTKAIYESDVLLMVLDGRVPDDGACVELGIAYALKKPCYGIKSDTRCIESDLDINPMLTGCFTKIIKNLDGEKLLEDLKEYITANPL